MSNKEIGDTFVTWNTVLDSFLIKATGDIMYFNNNDGQPLVEKILESAVQKGTGRWAAMNALDLGIPLTLISEAVFSRYLSSMKSERNEAARNFGFLGESTTFDGDKTQFLANLEQAL